jgi:hypothetical protein
LPLRQRARTAVSIEHPALQFIAGFLLLQRCSLATWPVSCEAGDIILLTG